MTTARIRTLTLPALVACALAVGCAHAPPATGSRGPNARPDPDYPEMNCDLNNTVDCRPGGAKG